LDKKRKKLVVDLCRELIQRQSYSGSEDAVARRMEQALRGLGYDDTLVDAYGNVAGQLDGNRPGKSILFDGHIDTVPVPAPSRWKHDPFAGELLDGSIYGRGAFDMKGAMSAMIAAASFRKRHPQAFSWQHIRRRSGA
jgi:acetylornithine deacetylase/succinyl-diaminopimelate desuccinylase-like protein